MASCRRLAMVGCAAAALSLVVAAPASASLDRLDRQRLAEARRAGEHRVTLLVAADRGQLDRATGALRALGGTVEARKPRVDYLQVSVPIGRADEAAAAAGVKAVDVDGLVPLDDPRPAGASDPIPQPPPDAATPKANPYLPIGDTGAAQWLTAHPTLDGRGTKIAILDSGTDLDHPALQTTTTGQRKVIDWFDANPPGSDGSWVAMSGAYSSNFTIGPTTWVIPALPGPYAFGVLKENQLDLGAGQPGGDLDRDGTPGEEFGVLQSYAAPHLVYVDVDHDARFDDEEPMLDYGLTRQVGHLGTDNPATPVVERMAFVVDTHRSDYASGTPFVGIGLAAHYHGTHVSGVAAGNGLLGGAMSGAAPGAQIISIKVCLALSSCTGAGMVDGMLYAAEHGADVANLSVGGLPALNNGDDATGILYNRIVDEYGMAIFIAAGNSGAGGNTVLSPAVVTRPLAIGASITKETWERNYGAITSRPLDLMPFSSRGPREDGGMKPELTAPGSAVSTIPQWVGSGAISFTLPNGYLLTQGTSMAAPEAAGAAALLVSAYVDEFGKRPPVAALRNALVSGAKFMPGVPAYGQGAGQIDVEAAWAILHAYGQANAQPAYAITARVAVQTPLAEQLPVADSGVGIYDRSGAAAGTAFTRVYTLTRTSGPAGVRRLNVTWLGNDGTFSAPAHVDLPLNKPTSFAVRVAPAGAGIHSATLRLDDPATAGVDHTAMNTVFTPHVPGPDGTVTVSGTIGRTETRHVLVRVPVGASLLKVDLAGADATPQTGQLRFVRVTPEGVPLNDIDGCYVPPVGECPSGSPTSRSLSNPMPGVWEIVVESRRTSAASPAPYTLTASVQGAEVTPAPQAVLMAKPGSVARQYTVRSVGIPFTGRLVGGTFATRRVLHQAVGKGQTISRFLTVPVGAHKLTVGTGRASVPGADIDVVVNLCPEGEDACARVGAGEGTGAYERVTVADPAPGRYRIDVIGYDVPDGVKTTFETFDSYEWPGLGSIAVQDANALRGPLATWTAPATITLRAPFEADRQVLGKLQVVTDAGAEVGEAWVPISKPPPPAPPRPPAPPPKPPAPPAAKPAFGSKTLVTLALARTRIGARGSLAVVMRNRNAFAVAGGLAGRVGKTRLRSKAFAVPAGGKRTVKLSLTRALRKRLARAGALKLRLTASVRDPAGNRRTVTRRVRLKARR